MNEVNLPSKIRYPRAAAIAVARELCGMLKPACLRLCVAGSLRRGKQDVGDVEILYIPRFEERQTDLFNVGQVDLVDELLGSLLQTDRLAKRINILGSTSWGSWNKLALHEASGIPVDLFRADEANWWNYLVCRTGPKESNVRICEAARKRGWQWNPYGPGFSRGGRLAGEREEVAMTSEQEVFEFVGLPYLPPEKRT